MLILNKIQLTGRVGKLTPQEYEGRRFVTIRIGVPDKYNKQDQKSESTWFNIVVNGRTAEFAEKYVGIGDYIYVEGRLADRKYADAQGVEKTTWNVYANELMIVAKKQEKSEDAPAPAPAAPAPAPRAERSTEQRAIFDENGESADDDLPF